MDARIKAILTHTEASGREQLAQHLAHATDLTLEAALAVLKVAPRTPFDPIALLNAETARVYRMQCGRGLPPLKR